MSEPKVPLTRRSFLHMVGLAGGASAVYETMTALGMLPTPEAWAGPLQLKPGVGKGQKVLILGAGIGGLTAAYELTHAGYTCEILEAQNRAGGRSLTARNGTVIHEDSKAHGKTEQVCAFAPNLYLNMGPGRLPYHHRRALHYCHVLGVPLEVYVMATTANLYQTQKSFGGDAMPRREVDTNARGYISELLAKAIGKKCLDDELSKEEQEQMLALLRVFGDLDDHDQYTGSTRAGCKAPLTVFQSCDPPLPLPLKPLLDSQFWAHKFYQPEDFEWQPTLFQPVGGMDQIVEGFKRKVGELIVYENEVKEIKLGADGVEVAVLDRRTGETCSKHADYCISNIPLPVLQKIPANFSQDFGDAVKAGKFAPACKVGWQANQRFWENDDNQIYGGISYIDDLIVQMWYPSNDYFTGNGTLTGAYNYDKQADELGGMTLEKRLIEARKGGVRLHKEFDNDAIVPQSLGLSIAWHNVPYQLGGWADWTEADSPAYGRLLAPDGRFHIVGDQVSTLPGWQEGAMMSAEHVVEQIASGQRLRSAPVVRAPNSRRLVQGRS